MVDGEKWNWTALLPFCSKTVMVNGMKRGQPISDAEDQKRSVKI